MEHPDRAEAEAWVAAEIDRLRAMSYEELVELEDYPVHYAVPSRTGRHLMGETQVFWDNGDPGPLRVLVDICEPQPEVVRSIAIDQFVRAPDGSFIDLPE
jgi:hypothetical protein